MANAALPHHLAALWFADIVGYSERAAQDERGALQLVEVLQTLARTTIEHHQGRIVKFMATRFWRNSAVQNSPRMQQFLEQLAERTAKRQFA